MKKIRYYIVKIYFSIKGFLKTVFKLKKEKEYTPIAVLSSSDYITKYYYRGDRTFCIIRQTIIPVIGGEFFDTNIVKYKYWEIGVMNFK